MSFSLLCGHTSQTSLLNEWEYEHVIIKLYCYKCNICLLYLNAHFVAGLPCFKLQTFSHVLFFCELCGLSSFKQVQINDCVFKLLFHTMTFYILNANFFTFSNCCLLFAFTNWQLYIHKEPLLLSVFLLAFHIAEKIRFSLDTWLKLFVNVAVFSEMIIFGSCVFIF